MANEVLKNDNSITLDWNDVSGATKYGIQVSKNYLDFRATLEHEDQTLVASTDSFTASGNGKYYWKWRAYVGSTWQPYSEVNSFIINTALASDFSATSWAFINKSDVTDFYVLELQPKSKTITPAHLWEARRRNRAGKLRSEQYTTKETISLDITYSYLGDNQKAEILRFFNLHRNFYLVTRYDNQTISDYVYGVWEAMFTEAPNLDTAGGNVLNFEEG